MRDAAVVVPHANEAPPYLIPIGDFADALYQLELSWKRNTRDARVNYIIAVRKYSTMTRELCGGSWASDARRGLSIKIG